MNYGKSVVLRSLHTKTKIEMKANKNVFYDDVQKSILDMQQNAVHCHIGFIGRRKSAKKLREQIIHSLELLEKYNAQFISKK